jgi:hypothetical protein
MLNIMRDLVAKLQCSFSISEMMFFLWLYVVHWYIEHIFSPSGLLCNTESQSTAWISNNSLFFWRSHSVKTLGLMIFNGRIYPVLMIGSDWIEADRIRSALKLGRPDLVLGSCWTWLAGGSTRNQYQFLLFFFHAPWDSHCSFTTLLSFLSLRCRHCYTVLEVQGSRTLRPHQRYEWRRFYRASFEEPDRRCSKYLAMSCGKHNRRIEANEA